MTAPASNASLPAASRISTQALMGTGNFRVVLITHARFVSGSEVPAPKWATYLSPGQRPGWRGEEDLALKGRHKSGESACAAPSGLVVLSTETQGVALGCIVSGRWPVIPASHSSLPAASLISTQALMNIRNLELRARRGRSAELHSAVPQVCNLRSAGTKSTPPVSQRPTDCKSAIQQIENLRYIG